MSVHFSAAAITHWTAESAPAPFRPLFKLIPEPLEPLKQLRILGQPSALALLQKVPRRGLAIVGTRYPQARSRNQLQGWIRKLQGQDLVIVSGLALGIDRIAHEAALEVGLPTIGILGSGLSRFYPPQNEDLRDRILAAGGLILSEQDDEMPPLGYCFLKRNRLLAAFSQATCIIEAPHRSGALNTARWARDLDRTSFAVPGYPDDPALAGNQGLLEFFNATPLWNTESLGAVWPELLALPNRPPNSPLLLGDDFLLSAEIQRRTASFGGATVLELLEWALQSEWPPRRFYTALRSGLETGRFEDHDGVLLKKPELAV